MSSASPTRPSPGVAVSHLVLNVRDIEVSHRFYTEALGYEQCGELDQDKGMTMRFYRSDDQHHHDLALVQVKDPDAQPEPRPWRMAPKAVGINHIALAYPDRQSWLDQIQHLQAIGVEFLVRGNHGMTHSVYVADPDGNGIEVLYDVPADVWQDDVNAALNHFELLPTEGPGALEDDTEYRRFSAAGS